MEDPKNPDNQTIACLGCGQLIALARTTITYIADALNTHSFSCPTGHCYQLASKSYIHTSLVPARAKTPLMTAMSQLQQFPNPNP